jgi:hypothetical protein
MWEVGSSSCQQLGACVDMLVCNGWHELPGCVGDMVSSHPDAAVKPARQVYQTLMQLSSDTAHACAHLHARHALCILLC